MRMLAELEELGMQLARAAAAKALADLAQLEPPEVAQELADELLPELFFPLCDEFKIEPNVRKLPDAIIGMDPNHIYRGDELPEDDPYFLPIPNPRATSPP